MFSKISRYRNLATVVTVDADGRLLASTELRLLPPTLGTFRHTINDGERLDQLAYKYYDQPRKWWRICDANPQFLSPLAMLGQGAVTSMSVALKIPCDAHPVWAPLLRSLRALPGVEDVALEEQVTQVATQHDGPPHVTLWMDCFTWAVRVTYNQEQVEIDSILQVIKSTEFAPGKRFAVGNQATLGQLGHAIIVPQDVIG